MHGGRKPTALGLHRKPQTTSLLHFNNAPSKANFKQDKITMKSNKVRTLTLEEERTWSNAIGGVFLNFGGIEFASYRWIEALSNDQILRDVAIDMNLARRIDLIKKLIQRSSWQDDKKKGAIDLWKEVSGHSKIRNTIAHNPMSFGRNRDGLAIGGIINVKEMKGPGPYEVQTLDVMDLVETARRVALIANKLHPFLEDEESAKDS